MELKQGKRASAVHARLLFNEQIKTETLKALLDVPTSAPHNERAGHNPRAMSLAANYRG
jgi:hypothetical protein